METTINVAVRSALETSCKSFNKVASDKAKLDERRSGSYTGAVLAAVSADSAEDFSAAYESLKADIIGNVGNVARKLGCSLGKPDKEGKARYVVPGGLMVAVSVIKAAFGFGIELVDDEDEPRSFGEIRKDVQKAQKAEADAKLTDLEKAQQKIRDLAASIAEGANALTLEEATECALILAQVAAVETGAAKKKTA